MTKHGRKYTEAAALIEAERRYDIGEAAELLPKLSIGRCIVVFTGVDMARGAGIPKARVSVLPAGAFLQKKLA